MKNSLIISCLFLAVISSCKKRVENGAPEFIGYWSGGSYAEYGYMYLNIKENSTAYLYCYDYNNDHDFHNKGTARIDGEKLIVGGTKYFNIVEYPHPIDTNIERYIVINRLYGNFNMKLANWKMVLDGLHGSSHCNVGNHTYYKADY